MRIRSLLVLLLLLASTTTASHVFSGDGAAVVDASTTPATIEGAPTDPAPTTPLQTEIQQRLARERETLDQLYVRAMTARDDATALEVQQLIEMVKQDTEVDLLLIQIRYAEQEGRDELATELKSAVEVLRAPARRGTPIERPLPDAQ